MTSNFGKETTKKEGKFKQWFLKQPFKKEKHFQKNITYAQNSTVWYGACAVFFVFVLCLLYMYGYFGLKCKDFLLGAICFHCTLIYIEDLRGRRQKRRRIFLTLSRATVDIFALCCVCC